MGRIPENHFSDEIMSRIRVRVLERQSLLPKNGELFRLGEIYSLLPEDMQEPSQICFTRILGQASSQRVPKLQTDPQALFALVVNLLAATRRSTQVQSKLSSRLTRWIDFLLEEYPLSVNTEDESDVLEQLGAYARNQNAGTWAESDGVSWLDDESGWLESKWLQWAWRVVNGEMVLIPLDPLQVLETGSPAMPKQAVLYVPQE
jgi:hypothetical protein